MFLVMLMYRRYIVVGVVFFLLVGAYFAFFNKDKEDKEYQKYYTKLVEKEVYSNNLDGIDLSIVESEENGKYSYIITLDNASSKVDDVKVLVIEDTTSKDVKYFPSFGIVDNKGYSLISSGDERDDKQVKGLNLTVLNSDKIENLLIYFSGNGSEQFVKVRVVDYLA